MIGGNDYLPKIAMFYVYSIISHLDELSEGVDTKCVDEVLHAGIGADFSVAVISLGCQDGFA